MAKAIPNSQSFNITFAGMKIDFSRSGKVNSHIISGSSIGNLWKVIRDNNFQVEFKFLRKLVISSIIVFFNIPFVLLEKLLYTSKIKNTKVSQPVFILGYPRSGTTYLMYLLSQDPRFAYCKTYECLGPHVIFTFGRVLRNIASRVIPKKRPMDNMEFGATLPKEEEFAIGNMGIESMANALYFPKHFSSYFDRFVLFNGPVEEEQRFVKNLQWWLKKLTLKNKGKRMLLKSPFNTGRVKILLKLYPDAKFIHIHRNPYSVFSSNEKLYESVLPTLAFHEISNEAMEEHLLYTYETCMNVYFDSIKNLESSQLYEVSFERLTKHPIDELRKAYLQLGIENFEMALPFIQQVVEDYSGYVPNIHTENESAKLKIKSRLQNVFDKLGYN